MAEKRAARSTRRPSSAKRSSALPTARMSARLEILAPVEGIDEVAVDRIEGDGVDGEVAAGQVGGDVVHELDLVRPPAVAVRAVAAEGGHLVVDARFTTVTVPCWSPVGITFRNGDDVVRPGVGGDVPVLGGGAAEQIADAPAHDPAAMVALLQTLTEGEHTAGNRRRSRSMVVGAGAP